MLLLLFYITICVETELGNKYRLGFKWHTLYVHSLNSLLLHFLKFILFKVQYIYNKGNFI